MDQDTPPFRYDARLANEIELRWQDRWDSDGTFRTPSLPASSGRPKFYLLDFFPYPSGIGLHVGHPLGYIGTDVFGRYLRMTGHHVLHPFGFDTFGLPAEQYAIDTGQHPAVTVQHNAAVMRRQLRRLGLAHDRGREILTSDPSYYRWTQWIFLQIFNSWYDPARGAARPVGELIAEFATGQRPVPGGRTWAGLSAAEQRDVIDGHRLAYLAEEVVNWCPGLGTVLADEEVTATGRSAVGNYPVYRRPLRQWMLRITAYGADTLRLYEMVMGPLDGDRSWQTDGIVGMHRFLQRLWRLIVDEQTGQTLTRPGPLDEATARLLHRTIVTVQEDYAALRFNTAIARIIELTGHAARLDRVPRALAEPLVLMVAPLAPHLAEELWQRLGHRSPLAYEPFPQADPALAADPSVTLPVQVNGKVRFTIDVPAAAGQAEIADLLAAHPGYPREDVARLVIVPGQIVSIVLKI